MEMAAGLGKIPWVVEVQCVQEVDRQAEWPGVLTLTLWAESRAGRVGRGSRRHMEPPSAGPSRG